MCRRLVAALAVALAGLAATSGALAQDAPGEPDRRRGPTDFPKGLLISSPARHAAERGRKAAVGRVRPNGLALKRLNAERASKGLSPLGAGEAGVAVEGSDPVVLPAPRQAGSKAAGASSKDVLPRSVDNSAETCFPPVGEQLESSCVAWVSTYYQLTCEAARMYGWDVKAGGVGDPARIFSPRWTYNFINGGVNGGGFLDDAYAVLAKHGAVKFSEFYDGLDWSLRYTAWCDDADAWRDALGYRLDDWHVISDTDTAQGLANVKQALANGHLVSFGTYISSWDFDGAVCGADDASLVGQTAVSHVARDPLEPHAMTLVGYDDSVWIDVNGNGLQDAAETGALLAVNSWGAAWMNGGFVWLAYDALRTVSAVPGGPTDRQGAFTYNEAQYVTIRPFYAPRLIAKLTVRSSWRDDIRLMFGAGSVAAVPNSRNRNAEWEPQILGNGLLMHTYYGCDFGGAGFDGECWANEPDSAPYYTLVFDLTDIVPVPVQERRYSVEVTDGRPQNPTAIAAFELVDLTDPSLGAAGGGTPAEFDYNTMFFWSDHPQAAPVAVIHATPIEAFPGQAVRFDGSSSYDLGGSVVAYAWDLAGVVRSGAVVEHAFGSVGEYLVRLTVTDNQGGQGSQVRRIHVTADSDHDGLSDGYESKISGTLASAPDSDSDGLADGEEIHHYGTDPLLFDTDGDGLSDGAEVMGSPPTDPTLADTDGDGLDDKFDPYPVDWDYDGDGLSDGEEVGVYGTQPWNADTDGDGMPDGWEVANGLLPLEDDSAGDPDGDGWSNLTEFERGSDPNVYSVSSGGGSDLPRCGAGPGQGAPAAAAAALAAAVAFALRRRAPRVIRRASAGWRGRSCP